MFLLPRPPMNCRVQTNRDRGTIRYGRYFSRGESGLAPASLSLD
jgi:hypothetical protein